MQLYILVCMSHEEITNIKRNHIPQFFLSLYFLLSLFIFAFRVLCESLRLSFNLLIFPFGRQKCNRKHELLKMLLRSGHCNIFTEMTARAAAGKPRKAYS